TANVASMIRSRTPACGCAGSRPSPASTLLAFFPFFSIPIAIKRNCLCGTQKYHTVPSFGTKGYQPSPEATMDDHVERHYAARSLLDNVMATLEATAPAGGKLKAADLAPLDQFHAGGMEATRQLA